MTAEDATQQGETERDETERGKAASGAGAPNEAPPAGAGEDTVVDLTAEETAGRDAGAGQSSATEVPAEPTVETAGQEPPPGRLPELRAVEAVCMASPEPVPESLLAEILEVSAAKVVELCTELAMRYDAEERGFELVKVAGGWRFQSHPDLDAYVERFVLDGQSARLSAAAMETLAIVAYKQPVSRAQIAGIRGVNVDGVMRTLQQRGLVAEIGRDPGPGQAVLYGTTPEFLERLGLDSVADLPPLGQFVPDAQTVETFERTLRPEA